jgi:hypothetical protein
MGRGSPELMMLGEIVVKKRKRKKKRRRRRKTRIRMLSLLLGISYLLRPLIGRRFMVGQAMVTVINSNDNSNNDPCGHCLNLLYPDLVSIYFFELFYKGDV